MSTTVFSNSFKIFQMSKLVRAYVSVVRVGRYVTRPFSSGGILNTHQNYVDITENNGVRTIKLNHPSSRNTLSLPMMNALLDGITRNEDAENLRSIVITGEPGKVFSAGHNLKELLSNKDKNQHWEIFETCRKLMHTICHSPVPVIAGVDGVAAAAGCQLVAACDIAVCTERSSFSTPGANVGVFCSTPGIPLVRNVSIKTALYMLFTGFQLTGKEAFEAGLVSKVVTNEQLDKELSKITDSINAKSRAIVKIGKKFIYEQIDLDMWTAYAMGAEAMVKNLELNDAQEGIRSFIEKRNPQWCHKLDRVDC